MNWILIVDDDFRLYDWKSNPRKDIRDLMKSQERNTQNEFQDRVKQVVGMFAMESLNAAIFYENPDPKTYVSMIPTSAATGDGMGNLMALIVELTQTALAKKLTFSEELQATVLEVKAIPGYGTWSFSADLISLLNLLPLGSLQNLFASNRNQFITVLIGFYQFNH